MNRLLPIAVAAFFSSATSATLSGRDVQGQVFIVTGGHETIKLALVPIEVYKKEDVESTIQSVDAELKRDRERIENFIAIVEAQRKIAELARKRLWDTANTPGKVNAAAKASRMDNAISLLQTKAYQRRDFLEGAGVYFTKLRKNYRPVAAAKSDADGKFSIQIPDQGEFALLGATYRRTGERLELYFWCVPAVARTDLTNDNLATQTTGSSLLYVKHNNATADSSLTEAELQAGFDKIKVDHADVIEAITRAINGEPLTSPTPTPVLPQSVLAKIAIRIQTPRGEIIIPRGTALSVISRSGDSLQVSYLYGPATIPVSSTNLQ